jgi:hypothetical protein
MVLSESVAKIIHAGMSLPGDHARLYPQRLCNIDHFPR